MNFQEVVAVIILAVLLLFFAISILMLINEIGKQDQKQKNRIKELEKENQQLKREIKDDRLIAIVKNMIRSKND